MRTYLGVVTIVFITFAACTTTEEVQEDVEPEAPIEKETVVPTWYNPGIHSSSDSLSIQGFAVASAMDSARATELSTQTAMDYLRFEIDRTAEQIRKDLDNEYSGDTYSSPSFIIGLRNAVNRLSLSTAEVMLEHESNERGVHYSYAKASISRTDLPELLSNVINDENFLNKLKTISP